MKKILILGADGMAGHVMAEYLSHERGYEVFRCDLNPLLPGTRRLDVTEFAKLGEFARGMRPDVVINCVGLLVKASQERPDCAILINSYLPHFLSRLGRELGSRLVHISTDCVFSGNRGGYSEEDFRDGDTPYARTKALGEVVNGVDLTLRTSIVGPELKPAGSGLLHWFLTQKGTVKGYTRTYWSGVTTLELARAAEYCIRTGYSGLVNLTMKEKISKHDLLVLFREIWGRNEISIVGENGPENDRSLVCARGDFAFKLQSGYRGMLADMRDFMGRHPEWYGHYTM